MLRASIHKRKAGRRICDAPPDSEAEVVAVCRIACVDLGLKRFAFMAVDKERSRHTEALFRQGVSLFGGEVVASDFYEQGSTDFKYNIERMRKASPEALYIASDSEDLILILPQLSFYEFGVQLLGSSAWNSKNLQRMAGRDMEGAIFPAN